MIYLIIFDFLVCSLTKYNLSLFLLWLPFKINKRVLIIYFLILSFFEIKYILNLVIVLLLIIVIDGFLKRFKLNTLSYLFICLISYSFYYGLINLINLL